MHSGTRRVRDDYVGVTVATDKLFVQHVFHVSCVEYRVVDIVESRIDFGIFNSLRDVFDAYDFLGITGHEVGNGSGSGVEVVHGLISG